MQSIKSFFKKIHNRIMRSRLVTSPRYSKLIIIAGILLTALIIFQAGEAVGFHRAMYAGKFGNNYYRAFDKNFSHSDRNGSRRNSDRNQSWGQSGFISGMMNDMTPGRGDFGNRVPTGFGAVGKIIKADANSLVVVGPDNVEKFVKITDQTIVRKFRDTLTIADLKANEYAVVIGEPNTDGQIVAKLIRILPPPPTEEVATSSNSVQ